MIERRCSVDGCGKPHYCKGYCTRHYQRLRRLGHTGRLVEQGPCSVAGCQRWSQSRGMCTMHYQRWRKHGDVAVVKVLRHVSLQDRFERYVDRRDGCWEWRGAHSNGYSMISTGPGRNQKAHRVAYELFVAAIPDGLEVDHLCSNRGCVNPAHLEPVTPQENKRRWAASLTKGQ